MYKLQETNKKCTIIGWW